MAEAQPNADASAQPSAWTRRRVVEPMDRIERFLLRNRVDDKPIRRACRAFPPSQTGRKDFACTLLTPVLVCQLPTRLSVTQMARPQTASDAQILKAASNVLARRGPDAFTLSDVAAEVGLSRAAIILRFKSAQALKLSLMTTMVDRFIGALEDLPRTPSGDNLLAVADFIGSHVGSRQGSARFFAQYSATVRDEGDEFAALTVRRGAALRGAIARVMPKTAIAQDSAVAAFSAHLSGSILSWLALDHADAHAYVMQRSREWLRLAGIPFTEAVDEPAAAKSGRKPARKRVANKR